MAGVPTSTPTRRAPGARPGAPAPVVVEARGVGKAFRIPEHRVDSLKERFAHPLTRVRYRELRALSDISFDVHRGEFFAIAGRNGSGKSTLLKILASIYRADTGTVRMAGRLAPFIELGVGFDPELTARENAVLNGVLMGLSKREARRRLDAILDFAELRDFVELKVKNYSSGMMVRLAFSIMVQADADVMLIDEVLAVGDAEFASKCMDVFHERHRAGKTIVLVTHDMVTVQNLCDRAMVIHEGELRHIGDTEEAALQYYSLNFDRPEDERASRPAPEVSSARVVDARLVDRSGAAVEDVAQGEPIELDVRIEALRELADPRFVVHVLKSDGTVMFGFSLTLAGGAARVPAGHTVRLTGRIENPLVPDRYTLNCWVRRQTDEGDLAVHALRVLDFEVRGEAPRHGLITVDAGVAATLEAPEPPR